MCQRQRKACQALCSHGSQSSMTPDSFDLSYISIRPEQVSIAFDKLDSLPKPIIESDFRRPIHCLSRQRIVRHQLLNLAEFRPHALLLLHNRLNDADKAQKPLRKPADSMSLPRSQIYRQAFDTWRKRRGHEAGDRLADESHVALRRQG